VYIAHHCPIELWFLGTWDMVNVVNYQFLIGMRESSLLQAWHWCLMLSFSSVFSEILTQQNTLWKSFVSLLESISLVAWVLARVTLSISRSLRKEQVLLLYNSLLQILAIISWLSHPYIRIIFQMCDCFLIMHLIGFVLEVFEILVSVNFSSRSTPNTFGNLKISNFFFLF